MPRAKKAAPKKASLKNDERLFYKGVKQVGDARLFNDANAHTIFTMVHVPVNQVGPCDIVDDLDPKKRYTFYLYSPSANDDSARERDRLRRAGFFPCTTDRFKSPTEKFEAKDGVLVLGQAVWYALPEAKMLESIAASRNEALMSVPRHYESLTESARDSDISAHAQTRKDIRGQRLEQ